MKLVYEGRKVSTINKHDRDKKGKTKTNHEGHEREQKRISIERYDRNAVKKQTPHFPPTHRRKKKVKKKKEKREEDAHR